jgi:hypothetical protein
MSAKKRYNKTVHSHDNLTNHINVSNKNTNSFIILHHTQTHISIHTSTFQYIFINFDNTQGNDI